MRKSLALIIGLATLGSLSSSAFADMLPEGQMAVPGCAMIDNIADFKNVIFIAATYNLEPKKELDSVVKIDNNTCISTGKYQKTELFAIRDDKSISKYFPSQPETKPEQGIFFAEPGKPQDPELDSNAFTTGSNEEIDLDGSDVFYPTETARSVKYYHRIYHVLGFKNDTRILGLVLSEEKTAVDNKKHEWTLNSDVWKSTMDAFSSIFTDVKGNDNYVPSVMFLKRGGYVNGYPDGSYKPTQSINRAEFTKIVMHDFKGTNTDGCNQKPFFKDVAAPNTAKETWYSDYICKAYNNGIIMGYSDNTFRPDQPITFAEAAKIILKVEGRETNGKTDPWYKEFTDYFQKYGFIPNTIKSHNKEITRGDMALMMRSIIDPLFLDNPASIIDPLFYKDTKSIIDPLFKGDPNSIIDPLF